MLIRILTGLVLALSAAAADYSKEAVVIEKMSTKVAFSVEGAREWDQTLSVRIQSEAALRQFGVLSFSYGSETEQIKVDYVRVRKADGSMVETPESSIRDVATQVAAAAPTYSDLRQKQVPVKALGVGDVLEYSVHSSQQKPEVAGQFWYTEYFITDSVVLNQTIEISVPKDKFAQVSSPKVKSETHDDGGQRVYVWHYSHLEVSKPDSKKKPVAAEELPKVEVTSFRNWEEVGQWWGTLASAQAVVTPAIADKAKELTAGFSSGSEKARALYNYVSLKYRYISISLGAGRYRPHSAAEVLANQYGDCKDKHTLFAALMKAAGIQAWPALIGAGLKFDAAVPSPAQFNHVITVVPEDGKYTWLDTTSEVAPYGLLMLGIRDEQALVIPDDGKPVLMKTPVDAPFKGLDTLDVKASLAADGTLTGHFDYRFQGDNALELRAAFRQLAPAQWQALAQRISNGMSFGGDVSVVEVENLENTEKPFHYSYDYNRKNYSDWAEKKITMPIPPVAFGPGDEADKPAEAFWAGLPGTYRYRASVQLPKGFAAEVPKDVVLKSAFADYSARYLLKDGVVTAEREVLIRQAKVPVEEWSDYQTFAKGVKTDQTTYIALSEVKPVSNAELRDLMTQAAQAIQEEKLNEARDLLTQAERLDPKREGLWAAYGHIAMRSGKTEEAVEDFRKELQFHPDEIQTYQQLSALLLGNGRRDEAIEVWRDALRVMPDNRVAASHMAGLLMQAKHYSEVPVILEKPIAAAPEAYDLQVLRARALLLGGHKEDGVLEAKRIAGVISDAGKLNDLAYYVSDAGADTGFAKDWAEKAISQTEQTTAKADLAKVSQPDLAAVSLLAAEWDTLGWIYFRQGNLAQAEKYVAAGWQLNQHATVADHLAAIYEKQGKPAQALHLWRLAAAAEIGNEEAREHLKKAGVEWIGPQSVQPAAELGALRTIKIPVLPKQTGSAEFLVLVSRNGIDSARLIGESAAFQNAAAAIQSAKYEFPFPDDGPEKLVRRGILSCSMYTTPSCQLTLLLPSTTKAPADSGTAVTSPKLVYKVEPAYTQAALAAGLEGKVVLSVVVNQEGVPEDVTLLESLGMGLDEVAEECVKKWRFNPGIKDGKPVKVRAKVEVSFHIQKPQ